MSELVLLLLVVKISSARRQDSRTRRGFSPADYANSISRAQFDWLLERRSGVRASSRCVRPLQANWLIEFFVQAWSASSVPCILTKKTSLHFSFTALAFAASASTAVVATVDDSLADVAVFGVSNVAVCCCPICF